MRGAFGQKLGWLAIVDRYRYYLGEKKPRLAVRHIDQ